MAEERLSANLAIKLVPLPVPAGVRLAQPPGLRQDGFRPASPPLPFSELSADDLRTLVQRFVNDVYTKAGVPADRIPKLGPHEQGGA